MSTVKFLFLKHVVEILSRCFKINVSILWSLKSHVSVSISYVSILWRFLKILKIKKTKMTKNKRKTRLPFRSLHSLRFSRRRCARGRVRVRGGRHSECFNSKCFNFIEIHIRNITLHFNFLGFFSKKHENNINKPKINGKKTKRMFVHKKP